MLQRAASNAYSWWWASHIRTKQSKWLEHNLQDMEEKVDYTLRIIDHDGDTFAKRAEMYYRKRPEIVNFVEESFRSYRALAERYDHLSRELQSANRTIATAFPEHIHFSLDDDDEEDEDKQPKHLHLIPKNGGSNIPQVPEIPKKDFRGHPLLLSRKGPQCGLKRIMPSSAAVATSGLTREEALDEIDKVQKGILALQTEKEFVRSSYENSYDRYWQLEDEITEMQKRVCVLQDEFGVGAEIDDSEARALMATTALNTCKETISKLEEKQKQSLEEAEIEKERIAAAKERFEALRRKFNKPEGLGFETEEVEDVLLGQELGTESVREMKKVDPSENLTVVQLVEKIDELVERVVSLETTASSNTALVKTLRSETDELHEHIRGLEEDKAALVSDSAETKKRITSLEEELSNVKSLFQRVEEQNKTLQKHFKEANITVEDLSDKVQGVKMDEGVEGTELSDSIAKETEKSEEGKDDQKAEAARGRPRESTQQHDKPETKDSCAMSETASTCFGTEQEDLVTEDEDLETPNWRQLLPDGMEDREKVILDEYTSVLRDYREVKRKLSDVEKKNRDGFFELALQIRELKNALAYKDVEIQSLHQKFVTPDKDSSPRPVEGNHSDLEGPCESMNISPISSFSAFTTPHQQGGDFNKKTPARTRQGEIRVKFADTDDSPRTKIPTVEEKVRSDIDTILEENLEFWLRFSTSVHQLQKYQTTVQDLKSELSKLKIESRKQQDSSTNPGNSSHSHASETRPIYRHLREIRTELQLWLENSAVLRDELQGRYASLCNIQDEISRVTSSGSGKASDAEISGYQAAKFHGEILNMKQENRKVSSEMQTGLDRVKTLKNDVERVLSTMEEDLGFSRANDTRMQNKSSSTGRPRIPLRSFLFGVKLKKHKQQKQSASASLFSCVSPSPALHKQNSYVNPQNLPE
ncbi:PREDICTED: protein NETWORKED 2A-like [Tarenaya hassleriana]|uniref:protein NETWORKED 2A-like n=1 Tax=Tarenaya hassleriana TaxID=28532 RepID=UPI00053C575F|nr:PREDICTED: protein NETWORKED 2A-like [Tarenaya hassleriana]